MRILQICPKIPFPPLDGGSVVMADLACLMKGRGHHVVQIAIQSPQQVAAPENTASPVASDPYLLCFRSETRPTLLGALANLLFSNEPYHNTRLFDKDLARFIYDHLLVEHYDLIQLESVYLLSYSAVIRKAAERTPIVLRTQNLEHRIWQGLSHSARGLKKWYLGSQAERIRQHEITGYRDSQYILPLTSIDAEWIQRHAPDAQVTAVAIGFHTDSEPVQDRTDPSFFHLAAMDWRPNQEAIHWFMRQVWPKFSMKFPDVHLHLAGGGMPANLSAMADHTIHVTGLVTDPRRYMNEFGVMIVPLRSGSGLRVKILEGMALGKAIISTPLGAAGLDVTGEYDILLAASPEQFVEQMTRCVNEPGLVHRIGNNARSTVAHRYAPQVVADELEAYYGTIIANQNPKTSSKA